MFKAFAHLVLLAYNTLYPILCTGTSAHPLRPPSQREDL